MTLLGADVSHWQTTTPTKGLSFLFVKATEGVSHDDPMYATHVQRAKAAGLHVGAYHFARDDAPIDLQALNFVNGAVGATSLAIDVEGPHALNRPETRALIAAVKAKDPLHRPVGLYMAERAPFFHDVGADFDWVANWSAAPSIHWDIHQFTSSPHDQDRAKDQATLERIFGKPPVQGAPHFHATVTMRTSLWNDQRKRWVYNGKNAVPAGTALVIRGARYPKGGETCWPLVPGTPYGGDGDWWVPVDHVKVGAKIP